MDKVVTTDIKDNSGFKSKETSFKPKFLTDDEWSNFKRDFVAGSVSGGFTALVTHPLDTWVVKNQAGTSAKKLTTAENLKSLGGRLTKTIAAGATGYPVFMYVSKKLSEKDEAVKTASLLAVGKGLLNFAKGVTMTGGLSNLKTVGGLSGAAVTTGAAFKFMGKGPTKLEAVGRMPQTRVNNFRTNQVIK